MVGRQAVDRRAVGLRAVDRPTVALRGERITSMSRLQKRYFPMRRDGFLLLRKRITSGNRSKVARLRGSRRWGSRWGSRRPEGCQLGNCLRSRPTKMSLLTVSLLTASRLMANLITKMSLLTVSLLTASLLRVISEHADAVGHWVVSGMR